MKTLLLLTALVSQVSAADFAKWWPVFQAAVTSNDAKAIVAGARFPMNWENGKIREIKTDAEFLENFNHYFTAEIRKVIATKKTERLPNGNYILTWKSRGNEYSLYFRPEGDNFVLDGLSEGPA